MPNKAEPSYTHSQAAFDKACRVMPGGVSSPVRAFKAVGGTPIFIKEARGCLVTDVDGNSYIDYVGSYGPLIAGHANERVVAASPRRSGAGPASARRPNWKRNWPAKSSRPCRRSKWCASSTAAPKR
jgi:glutamate-1-semialdehyde aminotransferase